MNPFFHYPIHTTDLSMGDTKKPLSGLISNILVFFDFLDEFFHEDQ
jgi:hypothetical protein